MTRAFAAALIAFALSFGFVSFSPDRASALCKPGSPNCVSPTKRTPKFCNPCQIDSGLGSKCKRTNTCGIKK